MKKLLLAASWLLVACSTFAQKPVEKSLLWKIEGKGLAKPSYLYGTIHVMCPDEIVVTPTLKSLFNSTQQLYLELDMDDLKSMAGMFFGLMMNDGSSLKTLLPKEDYDSLAVIYRNLTGTGLGAMSRMKPILLMSTIYPALLGCKPEGWEEVFMRMAGSNKAEILGLEKMEDQIAVLDSIPYSVQAEMFRKTLFNLDSTKASFRQMLEIYKQQDIQQMAALSSNDEDFGNYDEIMLRKRNSNWIAVMAAAAKKKPTFFAVGAAHLGGDDGVISLLRRKGYKVTPVKY